MNTDNKALADRLSEAADQATWYGIRNLLREAAAAISPQADKARGEVEDSRRAESAWRRKRLGEIQRIIEAVDNRAMANDGAVPSTMQEMTQREMSRIYDLARGVDCADLYTAPQPQGDGFTAADMMDARAEERARLSTPQVSGGGEAVELLREFTQAWDFMQPRIISTNGADCMDRMEALEGRIRTYLKTTPQARPSDDALWDQTIRERDEAEDALGRMFQAVTGRPAEWSSAWHYDDAIEEVEEHVAGLQQARPDGWDAQAYSNMRDDLESWKQRALTAEADMNQLCEQFNAENGPTHMGEPVMARPDGGEVAVIASVSDRYGQNYEWADAKLRTYNFYAPKVGDTLYLHPAPAQDNEAFRGLDSAGRPIYGNRPTITTTTADNTAPAPDAANGVPITPVAGDVARLVEMWPDAYAAFKGAFDTPMARKKDDSEYANDARDRLRSLDEALAPFTAAQEGR